MFTIAATISYALRHSLEYHIPAHTLNDNVWKPMFTHLENNNWNKDLPTVKMSEYRHQFTPIPYPHEDLFKGEFNVIIDGYRQSIKYFEDYLPEVRKAFGFDYGVKKQNTVAIHVRRGDYLNFLDKHPVVTSDYLSKAIFHFTVLGVATKNKIIIEFYSDDIEWCKLFVNKCMPDYNKERVLFSENKTELQDFQSMLQCENFIISNSTFSLMAAILSESPNKIVISPDESNWFGINNKHLSVEDLIPASFIKIKY